ncbi:DEAD/DEAH box helicase [Blastococcus brunescens]|uniref:DEAD/DEAH box helicase n=2 Tax=Blastococcus brunescens TaxID=1564165 RepID=A0ABZ1BA64_9ACTN|nr:DEAD/DEAH box helicase [Blastococcus sp. BMG 8361]WRL66828.1 DEAD/DEAH box helicase [Blastococcus sp. BMG 8361]
MDRIICGDVGYGKTEIAVRAAFKAVQDGKQVAVLVPTTLLANQHYKTFSERFAQFPVTVAVLSRFQSKTESDEIIRKLAAGRSTSWSAPTGCCSRRPASRSSAWSSSTRSSASASSTRST